MYPSPAVFILVLCELIISFCFGNRPQQAAVLQSYSSAWSRAKSEDGREKLNAARGESSKQRKFWGIFTGEAYFRLYESNRGGVLFIFRTSLIWQRLSRPWRKARFKSYARQKKMTERSRRKLSVLLWTKSSLSIYVGCSTLSHAQHWQLKFDNWGVCVFPSSFLFINFLPCSIGRKQWSRLDYCTFSASALSSFRDHAIH